MDKLQKNFKRLALLFCCQIKCLRVSQYFVDIRTESIKILEFFLDDMIDLLFCDFSVEMNHSVSITSHFGQLNGSKFVRDNLIFLKESGNIPLNLSRLLRESSMYEILLRRTSLLRGTLCFSIPFRHTSVKKIEHRFEIKILIYNSMFIIGCQ